MFWPIRCSPCVKSHTLVPSTYSTHRPLQQHPYRARRLRLIAAALGVTLLAAIFILALRTGTSESSSPAMKVQEEHDWALDALARGDLNVAPPEFSSDRPVYRYSVVPGGTHNPGELRDAIARDTVVAAHYSKLDQSQLRKEIVPADRLVHVSYRKGDQVFWTTKKVLLRKGETILTDGVTQIRTRCGNCIAEQPAGPTSPEEPDVVEFDRLTEALPGAAAPEYAGLRTGTRPDDPLGSIAGPSVSAPLAGLRVGGTGSSSLSADTPGVGTRSYDPLVAGAHETATPGDNPAPPGPDFDPPWPDLPLPPGEDEPFPPLNPFPPGPDDPKGPENPGPPTHEEPPGRDPENPTPVPEPGTLLLVGGGAAELIRRMRRRSSGR